MAMLNNQMIYRLKTGAQQRFMNDYIIVIPAICFCFFSHQKIEIASVKHGIHHESFEDSPMTPEGTYQPIWWAGSKPNGTWMAKISQEKTNKRTSRSRRVPDKPTLLMDEQILEVS
jgi:hypothetical protein